MADPLVVEGTLEEESRQRAVVMRLKLQRLVRGHMIVTSCVT